MTIGVMQVAQRLWLKRSGRCWAPRRVDGDCSKSGQKRVRSVLQVSANVGQLRASVNAQLQRTIGQLRRDMSSESGHLERSTQDQDTAPLSLRQSVCNIRSGQSAANHSHGCSNFGPNRLMRVDGPAPEFYSRLVAKSSIIAWIFGFPGILVEIMCWPKFSFGCLGTN